MWRDLGCGRCWGSWSLIDVASDPRPQTNFGLVRWTRLDRIGRSEVGRLEPSDVLGVVYEAGQALVFLALPTTRLDCAIPFFSLSPL